MTEILLLIFFIIMLLIIMIINVIDVIVNSHQSGLLNLLNTNYSKKYLNCVSYARTRLFSFGKTQLLLHFSDPFRILH